MLNAQLKCGLKWNATEILQFDRLANILNFILN